MRNIGPLHDMCATVRIIDDVDARIEQLIAARRIEIDPVCEPVDAVEHAAVRDAGDPAARMRGDNRLCLLYTSPSPRD